MCGGNAIGSERLAVHVDEPIELALATLLSTLGIVGETRTRVVERIDEEERRGTRSLG